MKPEVLEKILKQTKEFEEKTGNKVVYLTVSGSKLYGTDTPTSDLDLKGIFVPSRESVLLKKDMSSWSKNTNKTKEKNTSEDVDMTLHSVYEFFKHISKSETGGVDVLFSMFRKDTIVLEDKEFTDIMKTNYQSFMNRNMKSFIGYSLSQTKKFGIKGARYGELDKLLKHMKSLPKEKQELKLEFMFDELKDYIKKSEFKYIKFGTAPGPRSNRVDSEIEYFIVLGKMFSGSISVEYATGRLEKLFNQFGNRTILTSKTKDKTDLKALSHSLRIALEVEELLETGFINFPLKDSKKILEVKLGNVSTEDVVNEVEDVLARVDSLLEDCSLPEKSDTELMNKMILSVLK